MLLPKALVFMGIPATATCMFALGISTPARGEQVYVGSTGDNEDWRTDLPSVVVRSLPSDVGVSPRALAALAVGSFALVPTLQPEFVMAGVVSTGLLLRTNLEAARLLKAERAQFERVRDTYALVDRVMRGWAPPGALVRRPMHPQEIVAFWDGIRPAIERYPFIGAKIQETMKCEHTLAVPEWVSERKDWLGKVAQRRRWVFAGAIERSEIKPTAPGRKGTPEAFRNRALALLRRAARVAR